MPKHASTMFNRTLKYQGKSLGCANRPPLISSVSILKKEATLVNHHNHSIIVIIVRIILAFVTLNYKKKTQSIYVGHKDVFFSSSSFHSNDDLALNIF